MLARPYTEDGLLLLKYQLESYLGALGKMLEAFPLNTRIEGINFKNQPYVSSLRIIAEQVKLYV